MNDNGNRDGKKPGRKPGGRSGAQRDGNGPNKKGGPQRGGGGGPKRTGGPGRDGPRRDGPRRDGPVRSAGPNRDGPNRDGPRRDGPNRDGPRRDGPNRDGPRRDGPVRSAGPNRDGPNRDGPRRDGPNRDGPRRDGPRHDGPRRDGPRRDGSGRDGPPRRPKRIQKAEEKVLTPTRWFGRGEAIVEGQGKQILVWGGIPGEAGRALVHFRGNYQDKARWLSAENPSPIRRVPPCDKYDRCGGCPLMHLEPAAQQDARLSIARDLFQKNGLDLEMPTEVQPCPDGDENYRYVVKMACGRSDWGRPRLGAYERDSHKVLPIPNCRVATSALRRAMGTVTHQILENGIPPYDTKEDTGVLRHVIIRESRLTSEMLVTLVCARRPRDIADLAEEIIQSLSMVVGVHMHINSEPGNAIFNAEDGAVRTVTITGKATIDDEIAGVRMRFGPTDFFQANPATAEVIVRDVLELSADLADRPVIDLYCGVGTFALPMAGRHPWVGGIEYSAGAVDRAKANAQLLKVRAEFLAGPVAEMVPQWASRVSDSAPVVVLDPARKGIEAEAFDPIESLKAARMFYVSCNPAALARDLAEWIKRGWTVDTLRAYDMFPQTSHLEMLAVLSPPIAPVAKKGGPRRRIVR
jgi:23S rRNA (uracil1939-C5)-methyltransferase